MKKFSLITFWVLIGVFLAVLAQFFVPAVGDLFMGSILFLAPFAVFSLLGAVLLFLAIKGSVKGILKKFLILTGASAAGFFVCVFLHNAFYALAMVTNDIIVLNYLIEALHVIFFLIAIFACPVGFLIGAVGSIVMLIKKRGGE